MSQQLSAARSRSGTPPLSGRRINVDELLANLSATSITPQLSTSSAMAGSAVAQPSLSAVPPSLHGGAPPLRPADPFSLTGALQDPSVPSVSSVGVVGGGVLADVSAKGKADVQLNLHMLSSYQGLCMGTFGDGGWGVCLSDNPTLCPRSHATVVTGAMTHVPSEGDRVLVVPAVAKRLKPLGITRACYKESEFKPEVVAIWENDTATPTEWADRLNDPANLKSSAVVDVQVKQETSFASDVSLGSWEDGPTELASLPPRHDIRLPSPLEFNFNDTVPEISAAVNEHTQLFGTSSRVNSLLIEALSNLHTFVSEHSAASDHNVTKLRGHLSEMLPKLLDLQEDLGDMDVLSDGSASLVEAVNLLLSHRVDTLKRFQATDADFDAVVLDVNEVMTALTQKVNDLSANLSVPPKIHPVTNSGTTFDQSTMFTVNGRDVSLEEMSRSVWDLQAKSASSDSAAIGTANYKEWSFPDDAAAEAWLIEDGNPAGYGIAGLVDGFSLFQHDVTKETLANKRTPTYKTLSERESLEDLEIRIILGMHSMTTIQEFYGSGGTAKEGTRVKCFTKAGQWLGENGLTGIGTDILHQLTQNQTSHSNYLNDHVSKSASKFVKFCTTSATDSLLFWTRYEGSVRSNHQSLSQFGLPKDDIMQLFSDWMHILTTRIYDIRRKAFTGGNNVSMVTRLARQVCITCQVLAYQDELVQADFTKHPSMASAYLRHLTVHLGKLSPSDAKLSQKLKDEIALSNKALENSVDKNVAEVAKLQRANQSLENRIAKLENKLIEITKYHPELLRAKRG